MTEKKSEGSPKPRSPYPTRKPARRNGGDGQDSAMGLLNGSHSLFEKPDLTGKTLVIEELPNLMEKGEVPSFDTDDLTGKMVNTLLAHVLNGGFYATPAGYVSMNAGLSTDGEVVLTLTHWKSFNFAEQDEIVQTSVHVGNLVKAKATEKVRGRV